MVCSSRGRVPLVSSQCQFPGIRRYLFPLLGFIWNSTERGPCLPTQVPLQYQWSWRWPWRRRKLAACGMLWSALQAHRAPLRPGGRYGRSWTAKGGAPGRGPSQGDEAESQPGGDGTLAPHMAPGCPCGLRHLRARPWAVHLVGASGDPTPTKALDWSLSSTTGKPQTTHTCLRRRLPWAADCHVRHCHCEHQPSALRPLAPAVQPQEGLPLQRSTFSRGHWTSLTFFF